MTSQTRSGCRFLQIPFAWKYAEGMSMICLLSTSQVGNTNVQTSRPTETIAGLIPGGNRRDSVLVERLATQYISRESCIILLTIACESTLVVTYSRIGS